MRNYRRVAVTGLSPEVLTHFHESRFSILRSRFSLFWRFKFSIVPSHPSLTSSTAFLSVLHTSPLRSSYSTPTALSRATTWIFAYFCLLFWCFRRRALDSYFTISCSSRPSKPLLQKELLSANLATPTTDSGRSTPYIPKHSKRWSRVLKHKQTHRAPNICDGIAQLNSLQNTFSRYRARPSVQPDE